MISVIIPTYNRADALEICLHKLLAKKGVDFEMIVVDDGSTDETQKIVKRLQAPSSKLQAFRRLCGIKRLRQKSLR